MSGLSEFLVDNILGESTEQSIALFGGGFKPPTKGHLGVILKGLQQSPEVNKVKILVGQGERDGFTQAQSIKIWKLYRDLNLIPANTEIIAVKSPFEFYKKYLRDNPTDKVYVFIGSREGNDDDQLDLKQRSNFIKKYSDNVIPLEVSSTGGISGTEARRLFKTDVNAFREMFPSNLNDHDWESLLKILGKKQPLSEGKYDSLASKLAKMTLNQLKKDFESGKENSNWKISNLPQSFIEKTGLDFEFRVYINFQDGSYSINGNANPTKNLVTVKANIPLDMLPESWERIYFDLLSTIRHEIQHLTKGQIEMDDDYEERNQIKSSTNHSSDYYKLEKEIDSNVAAFYLKAKKTKQPFSKVLNNYFNYDIQIPIEDREELKNQYLKRAKELNYEIFENKILSEGRYDTISNQISSDIFKYWKDNIEDRIITFENTYEHEGEDIDVEAILKQTPEIKYLNVDGGADDETDYILVSFEVNPYELPQALEDISFNLKDVVRHEIEHLTHGNSSHSKPGKYMENDEFIRQSIKAGLLSKHRYFELEKEIDANLQGMYFRAKKEKRPFKDIINVYLDAQDITSEEKEGILNLWRKRNKALNLPLFENEETLNEVDLKKYVGKAKEGFKKFLGALKQEGKESKDAFKLLSQSVKGEKQLSKEEKKEIGNQLKDIFKTIGYVGLFLLPGGSIFSILFNVLKLNKYVLPSAFQSEGLNEAITGDKILYAFDLDDTLITSNSKVIINHPDKETQQLTPAEYAVYEPQPGDEPDFSEFANLKDPKVIKDNFNLFSQILNKSSKLAGAKTIILTARQPEVSTDVETFLEKNNLPQITLHAVGSSDPNEKLKVIEDYIDQGFNKIRFYDDSPKNVKSIKSISRPGVDVVSKLVKHGPLSERFLNEAIVGDKIECDKCDWSWDIKDGGDDLYVCHKCGYDNEPLNEDINSNTYPFKITNKEYDDEDDSLLNITYQFSTPNNIYRVEFNSFEYSPEAKTFDLSFGVNTGDLNQIDTFQMTGEGNARKIFKTILDIIEDFISKEDIKKIVVDGTDEKRKRIYKSIFSTSSPNISSKIVLKENKINDPFGLIQFVNEVAEESEFDYTKHIDSLNNYMVKNKMNVSPLPKVTFIDDDVENANDVMGKTAYYDPNKREVVLYTLLRHPKDILRSYAHEMIHHIQNLEDRLGNITTTNTTEDDNLTAIEKEAYTDGNLTFRKWTETINEITNQEMRYWAFHGDIFSELRKWGVEKYNELKKLAKGERLKAVEHFWDLLKQGKLSEDAKDLAPQEEVRIFNENCGCGDDVLDGV